MFYRLCTAQGDLRRQNETEPTCTPHAKLCTLVQCWIHLRKSPFSQFAQRHQVWLAAHLFWGGSTSVKSEAHFFLHMPNSWVEEIQVGDQENGYFIPSFESLESELDTHSTSLLCDLGQIIWLLWASVSSLIPCP